jgi:hypothetical protein
MKRKQTDIMSPLSRTQLVMTTTGELFLPTRIIYQILDEEQVRRRFHGLRCLNPEPLKGRWTWIYEHEAKSLAFSPAYEAIPPERQPVVLATCYVLTPEILHVYVRSTERLIKALSFFDTQFPRTCLKAEFMDEYNLLTSVSLDGPRLIPTPEDFFKDESRIQYRDPEQFSQGGDALAAAGLLLTEMQREMAPLERHRLDAYYEDGPEYLVDALKLRELLAMKQHESGKAVRPYQVIEEIMRSSSA